MNFLSTFFFYVGNLYPHKNIKRAIEAVVGINKVPRVSRVPQVPRAGDAEVYFVIVCGRGVFRHRLEKQIEKLQAKEYVKILDFVPDEELHVLYSHSLAFIFPSLSEGFGLPGLEAMQSGTLVLASNTPVFNEIYDGKALYFDPKDAESIERVMKKVVGMKKEERAKRIKDGKSLVTSYSWEKMAKETLGVYKSNA